jgi:ribosomal protein L37E
MTTPSTPDKILHKYNKTIIEIAFISCSKCGFFLTRFLRIWPWKETKYVRRKMKESIG